MDRLAHLDTELQVSAAGARVAVIGAGYAGLAAAVELAALGISVTVFESSRVFGGRARGLDLNGMRVDNGQHILIGAYRELLRLMRRVGAPPAERLLRLPLTVVFPGRLSLIAPRLPAPLHLAGALLCAHGLSWQDRLAAIRFMRGLRQRQFRLPEDMSVAAMLEHAGQPDKLCRYLWEPLCVSALNTPAGEASAQIFLNVLRDGLAGSRDASDLLLPQVDLSSLFPDPAATFIARRGGELLTATPIRAIRRHGNAYELDGDPRRRTFATVILAVAPYHAGALLNGLPEAFFLAQDVGALVHEPILTCYLSYQHPVRLPYPMVGGRHAHWLFDRHQLGGPPGLVAGVISAQATETQEEREQIAARVHEDVRALIGEVAPPLWHQVIVEKRATFRCLPGLKRPGIATGIPGLYLCGDYVDSEYPATLESAVRSGVECARAVIGTKT